MMKRISYLLITFCFSIFLYGQEVPSKTKLKTSFGLKAGFNLVNTKTNQTLQWPFDQILHDFEGFLE